jgi:hypothetical protein
LRCRLGSEDPQGRSGDQVALKVEIVMDSSMQVEKALGRSSRLEPLQFPLASSHDLVGILGAIVRPQASADEGRSGQDAETRMRKSPACQSSAISVRSPVS